MSVPLMLSDGELDAVADVLVERVGEQLGPSVAAAVVGRLDALADEVARLTEAVAEQRRALAVAARAFADSLD